MKKIIVSLFIFVALFTFSSCGKVDNCSKMITSSIKSVNSVVSTTSILDQGEKVYEQIREVIYDDETNATIKTTTSKMNSSFVLESSSSLDSGEVKKEELVNVNLNKKVLQNFEEKDGVYTFDVAKENVGQVISIENVEIADNTHFVLTFDNKKIVNITCTFKTSSQKDVTIRTEYTY